VGSVTERTVRQHLESRGMSRRDFLRLCASMAGWMGVRELLPLARPPRGRLLAATSTSRAVARALEEKPRLPVIWLEAQDCAGCTEALVRSLDPLLSTLLFDVLSLEYHETLSAAASTGLSAHMTEVTGRFAGQYLLVVEGSVPLAAEGAFMAVGGRSFAAVLDEAASGAAAAVATGNCASFGGVPAARPNPTGAVAARHALASRPDLPWVNVPGCPAIPEVTAGVLAYYFVNDRFPDVDDLGRPLTHYGSTVHQGCPRRPHFRSGEFAAAFDDERARAGWCLFELGCRGPVTFNECSTRMWANGVSWPVASGHPCLGCSEPGFWDDGERYPWAPRAYADFLPRVDRRG
jgi:hydrogenase small subunit